MTYHSLSLYIDLLFPQQHIKGLLAFKRGGHLTDSTAQKKATRAKGQGYLPARQQVSAALLWPVFTVDIKWKSLWGQTVGRGELLRGIAGGKWRGENWRTWGVHTEERRGAELRQWVKGWEENSCECSQWLTSLPAGHNKKFWTRYSSMSPSQNPLVVHSSVFVSRPHMTFQYTESPSSLTLAPLSASLSVFFLSYMKSILNSFITVKIAHCGFILW